MAQKRLSPISTIIPFQIKNNAINNDAFPMKWSKKTASALTCADAVFILTYLTHIIPKLS